MATIIRGKADADQLALKDRLEGYEKDHPGARAELYRQNPASIRLRVIDDRFAEVPRFSRDRRLQKYLKNLDEEVQEQITMLLLLPTSELQSSMANMEFEDPIPSGL
jgi:hypothetical protein